MIIAPRHGRITGQTATLIVCASTMLIMLGCSGDPTSPGDGPEPFTYDEPWPSDLDAILTAVFTDDAGDQEALPPEMAGTPYGAPVLFPSVDVTRVALGVDGDFLYMRVDFAGTVPIDEVRIAPDGDVHNNVGQVEGELGFGGAGETYGIVRYDVSDLGDYFPRGATVELGSWSEAESFDADGELLYHHFAFDRVIDGGSWSIPQ